MRGRVATLIVVALVAACSTAPGDETTTTTTAAWSTDDFQETVAYCRDVYGDAANEVNCPGIVASLRDGGCTVEETYLLFGAVGARDSLEIDAALLRCGLDVFPRQEP